MSRPSAAEGSGDLVGAPAWRAAAQRVQEQALPRGGATVSCTAAVGAGGLGRHLQEILLAFERAGTAAACVCGPAPGEPGPVPSPLGRALRPLGRFSPAWRLRRMSVEFDRRAARALAPAEHFLGFNGTSLAQLRAARAAGARSLAVVSATCHLRHLVERHAAARRRYPLERSWATGVLRRNLAEYALADRIYVSSRYVLESFLARGFDERSLALFPLTPDPRFEPGGERDSSTFEVVYVGGLTVDKGVPLLIDAFRRLGHEELRLRLVGGWKTRAMRRFVGEALAADTRIEIAAGDPLTRLRSARLYVHAAYSDGFGYAPAEAMACGVPVLVTEETGMKDLVAPGRTGLVLPAGDLDALAEAIDAAYRGEILAG